MATITNEKIELTATANALFVLSEWHKDAKIFFHYMPYVNFGNKFVFENLFNVFRLKFWEMYTHHINSQRLFINLVCEIIQLTNNDFRLIIAIFDNAELFIAHKQSMTDYVNLIIEISNIITNNISSYLCLLKRFRNKYENTMYGSICSAIV